MRTKNTSSMSRKWQMTSLAAQFLLSGRRTRAASLWPRIAAARSSAVWDMRPRRCSRGCLATSSRVGMSASFRFCVGSKDKRATLLNNLVCSQEQRLRNRQAQRLRSLEVDHQLELRWLLDGQVAGLGSFEDLVHVDGRAAEHLGNVCAVTHDDAGFRELPPRRDRGQVCRRRQLAEAALIFEEGWRSENHQRSGTQLLGG